MIRLLRYLFRRKRTLRILTREEMRELAREVEGYRAVTTEGKGGGSAICSYLP
jgi:hypothetical protein